MKWKMNEKWMKNGPKMPTVNDPSTVPIKSIRRSRVTGLLNLTKSHRGHTKIMKNLKKSSKKEENFLQITIIIS